MRRILMSAHLLVLLIFGSACSDPVSETSALQVSPKVTGKIKSMLETARDELRRYEEELAKTEKQIRDIQGNLASDVSPRLLVRREQLKEKVFQSKVNVRELEILLNEEH